MIQPTNYMKSTRVEEDKLMNLNGLFRDDFPDQYVLLAELYKNYLKGKAVMGVEVGCGPGYSTAIIGNYVKKNHGLLYAVNTVFASQQLYTQFITRLNNMKVFDNVFPMKMQSKEAIRYFDDGCLDFVFLHSESTYSEFKTDLDLWYNKLKIGGIISGKNCEKKFTSCSKKEKEIIESNLEQVCVQSHPGVYLHPGVIKSLNEKFHRDFYRKHTIWWHIRKETK